MALQTRYLFTASMDVEPAQEKLFNEVYDTEHVPLLLKVPGVIAVARLKKTTLTMIIGGEKKTIVMENEPTYSATYEIESPEVLTSPGWGAALSTKIAMWVPTLRAVAVTAESVVGLRGSQLSVLHTLKVRTRPESTGVTRAGARGGARSGRGSCAANSRSERRNRRSNCCATLGPAGAAIGARGAGGAARGFPPSLNGCKSFGMLVAPVLLIAR